MKKSNYLLALAFGASTLTFAQVGIGTSSPSVPLDIQADDAAIDLNNSNTGDSDPVIHFQLESATTFSVGVDDTDDKLKIATGATGALETNTAVTVQSTGEVGIGTTSPVSGLDVQTSMGLAHAAVSADYTLDEDDNVVLVDDAGADRTITLPLASGNSGRVYYIKKTSSSENKITIQRNTSATIDGATSVVLYVQYDAIRILCDGTNWHLIADERKAHTCVLTRNTAQSIANNATTTLSFNNEEFDIGGIGDITTDNRVEIKRAGKYLITGQWTCPNVDEDQFAFISLRVNGVDVQSTYNYGGKANGNWTVNATTIRDLSAGDFIDFDANQITGIARNSLTNLEVQPRLCVQEIR